MVTSKDPSSFQQHHLSCNIILATISSFLSYDIILGRLWFSLFRPYYHTIHYNFQLNNLCCLQESLKTLLTVLVETYLCSMTRQSTSRWESSIPRPWSSTTRPQFLDPQFLVLISLILDPQFLILDPWFLVPGPWSSTPRPWSLILDTQFLVLNSSILILNSSFLILDPQLLVLDPWYLILNSSSSIPWYLILNSLILDPQFFVLNSLILDPRFLILDPWFLVLDPWPSIPRHWSLVLYHDPWQWQILWRDDLDPDDKWKLKSGCCSLSPCSAIVLWCYIARVLLWVELHWVVYIGARALSQRAPDWGLEHRCASFWKRLKVTAWLVCGLLLVAASGIGGWPT